MAWPVPITVETTVASPEPITAEADAGTFFFGTTSGGGTGDVVGPNSAVDGEVAVFDGASGKTITGGGVLGSAALADAEDFATATQGQAADTAVQPGDLPSFGDIVTRDASEFEVAGAAASAVSAHAGAADPHGDRAYAAGLFATNDALLFKGAIDCSGDPNYPAADCGHTYRVSVAGKIGGASGPNVEVGELVACMVDGTAAGTHASVGASWSIAQTNIDGAVVGPSPSVVDGDAVVWDGTSGRLVKTASAAPVLEGDARLSDPRAPSYGYGVTGKSFIVDGGSVSDYCVPGVIVVQPTSWTPSTNRGCIEVIELARTMTFDRVGGEVITPGTASTVIRGGIYTADEHWQADQLVLDWGTIPADAAAFHSLTINLTLTPGRYVVCWTPGSSPVLRGLGTYWPNVPILTAASSSLIRAQGSNLGGNTNPLPSTAGSQQKWATATGTTVAQRQNFWRFREAA